MEPAPRHDRPDATSPLLMILLGAAAVCALGILLVWPFAILYVAVGPVAAFLFVTGCFGALAYVMVRLTRGRNRA